MMNVGYSFIPFSVCIVKLLPSIRVVAASVICFLAIYPSMYNMTHFLLLTWYENTKNFKSFIHLQSTVGYFLPKTSVQMAVTKKVKVKCQKL